MDRLRDVFQKAAALCKSNRRLALTVLLLLLGLIALAVSAAQPRERGETEPQTAATVSAQTYAQEIEERLTALLSEIDGVGHVQVMVTLESGGERYYLSNKDSGQSSDAGGRSSADLREDYVIIRSGSDEQGILVKASEPEIRGVAVVCSGGDDATVQARIVDTVSALLHLSSARISVQKWKTGSDSAE
ncbi:MAG: hypothetical protein IK080_06035 [Clostridia bacterium]|nr:hypothetical protein [Clostridia bacterium]